MKKIHLIVIITALMVSLSFLTCGSIPTASVPDELDKTLREVSDYLNGSIPSGRKIAFINIQSESAALTEYIVDELISNAVNDRIFSVVDRQQLDAARTELNFNMSGEVSDQSAQSVGQMLGAQTIITGRVSQIGERYRLNIRALEVETGQVQGSNNWNIAAGATITVLMKGNSRTTGRTQATTARTGNDVTTTRTVPADPPPAGALVVNNVSGWNTAINTIRNGGNNQTYVIHVTGSVSVPAPPSNENLFGSVTGITVTIQGSGTLSLSVNGSLLRIGAAQTVVVKDVTLRGRSNNDRNSLVVVGNGGIFRMEGRASVTGNGGMLDGSGVRVGNNATFIMQDSASVTGNSAKSGISWGGDGGGVNINGGTFIMRDNASVSSNTTQAWSGGGGGVYLGSGTFTMHGGTISGNTLTGVNVYGGGGGVYIGGGTFIMQGGTIAGNTYSTTYRAPNGGGGVYVAGGRFTMEGGTITGGNNSRDGGGVLISGGNFTKTGGTISGNDAELGTRNSAQGRGHALFLNSNPVRWRNATAGPDDNTGSFGFWMND